MPPEHPMIFLKSNFNMATVTVKRSIGIVLNEAETNCTIVHILGILLMNY